MMPPPPATISSIKTASQGSSSNGSFDDDDSAFLAALAEAELTPPKAAAVAAGASTVQIRQASPETNGVSKGKQADRVDLRRDDDGEMELERSIALAEEQEEEEEQRRRNKPSVVHVEAGRHASSFPWPRESATPRLPESFRKRARFDEANADDEGSTNTAAAAGPSNEGSKAYLQSNTYAPTKFGDFTSFMKNKRAKLKVQETSLVSDEADVAASAPPLFAGTNIYINGHTDPPYNELRRLLLLYGGSHMAYLDTKSPCTHIIASSLTPKKRIEFKDYKVVTPQWVTASIAAGKRLDWRNFRCGADAAGALGFGVKAGGAPSTQQTQSITATGGSDWRQVGQAIAASQSQRQGLVPTQRTSLRAAPHASTSAGSSSSGESATSKQPQSTPPTSALQAATSPPKSTSPWGMTSAQQTLGTWVSRPAAPAAAAAAVPAGASREATPPPSTADELPKVTLTTPSRKQTLALAAVATPPPSSPPAVASSSRLPSGPAAASTSTADVAAAKPPNALQLLGQRTPTRKAADEPHPIYSSYASRPSNASAARLLSSPSWRRGNTATSDSFLAGYFAMSRLHHLSTWKLEMQELVAQAVLDSGRTEGSVNLPPGVQRVIFHVDFDAFFVNVGLRRRPELRDRPVVVCHGSKDDSGAPLASTSEIASCNYIARAKGVRNGSSLGAARKLCPDVQTIAYDFEAYNEVSIQLYTVLLAHADALEAVSVDEALLDVSMLLHSMRQGETLPGGEEDDERRALMAAYRGHLSSQGEAWSEEKQLAEALRDRVRNVTGCEVSIGVGADVLQARLATRKAKPAGSFHLRPEAVLEFTAALEVDDLHGVGWKMRGECQDRYGTVNVGELRSRVTEARLIADQGAVAGPKLWNKLHGKERDRLEGYKQRKSVSANVNYGMRFVSRTEAEDFVRRLCHEVSHRLKKARMRGGAKVIVDVMVRKPSAPVEAPKFLGHGICDKYHKSKDPPGVIVEGEDIFKYAWPMIKLIAPEATELRGIGVTLQKLEPVDGNAPVAAAAPPPGQSLLKFRPVPRPAAAAAAPAEPSEKLALVEEDDEEQDEEEQDQLPPLQPGVAAPSRRSLTPEPAPRPAPSPAKPAAKPARIASVPAAQPAAAIPPRHVPIATLAATQFAIPSISQIDPRVISELPRHIVAQIEAARTSRAASEDVARALSAEPPTLQQQPRQNSEAPAVRSKSISPVKRKVAGSSNLGTNSSSSSKLSLPEVADMDPSFLEALPPDIRDELIREAGIRSRSAAGTRSLSESPRKKQRTVNRVVPRSATSGSLAPFGKADQPRVKVAVQASDPSKVTAEQLQALEIDVEFYRGLPSEVQRELLLQQERVVESKRKRFKGGRRIQERTTAEERRFDAEKAAKLADVKAAERGDFQPLVRAVLPSDEVPAIRGRSDTKDVVQLLDGWYAQFRSKGPRETDVARFLAFLQACVTPQHARCIEMEKAATILKCWKRLLDDEEEASSSSEAAALEARAKWNTAFETVYQKISELVRQRFGFGLSLK